MENQKVIPLPSINVEDIDMLSDTLDKLAVLQSWLCFGDDVRSLSPEAQRGLGFILNSVVNDIDRLVTRPR